MGDSELQRQDVIELLERTWDRLDLGYLERWVGDLDLKSAWDAVVARATLPPDSQGLP